ncbi:MAG: ABC transporter permease/substrate-binding protein, partial [Planctomycetota bacterium]
MTRRALLLLLVVSASCVAACGGADVTVGSKKFTESVILGEIAVQLAQREGYETAHERELGGTRVLFGALQRGDIDVYPEYTGTISEEILAGEGVTTSERMRSALQARGVLMTAPLGFNNTYALGMRKDRADALGVTKISDLKAHPDLVVGFSNEFLDRADGWPHLRSHYDLPQEDVTGLDHDLAYRSLQSGEIDLLDLYSTDAEISQYDLAVLEDDLRAFPRYEAVFLYRADLVTRAPAVAVALTRLEGRIGATQMTQANKRVKIDRETEASAAGGLLGLSRSEGGELRASVSASAIVARTGEHLVLVGVSLLASILVGVPLGLLAARRRVAGHAILGVVGILQTVPSFALLVFMIPLFGIGAEPAIAALFLYSLLPIVRNTHAGIHGIAPALQESAEALGLTPAAKLRLVELPLASRSILAGVKTSAVINVGTATLGALIGAGGYGRPILTGIRLDDMALIMSGAVPAAVLALL